MAHLGERRFYTRKITRFLKKTSVAERAEQIYQKHAPRLSRRASLGLSWCSRLLSDAVNYANDVLWRSLHVDLDPVTSCNGGLCHYFSSPSGAYS